MTTSSSENTEILSKPMAQFHKHRSLTEKILGIILIIAGLFSTIIPGIPGFVLILLGLTLLGERRIHRWWHEKLKPWIKKRGKNL